MIAKKKKQPVMIVIPPAPPQPQVEEVEVCEKVGERVVCRRKVATDRKPLLA